VVVNKPTGIHLAPIANFRKEHQKYSSRNRTQDQDHRRSYLYGRMQFACLSEHNYPLIVLTMAHKTDMLMLMPGSFTGGEGAYPLPPAYRATRKCTPPRAVLYGHPAHCLISLPRYLCAKNLVGPINFAWRLIYCNPGYYAGRFVFLAQRGPINWPGGPGGAARTTPCGRASFFALLGSFLL
jgi:hypothetical protein